MNKILTHFGANPNLGLDNNTLKDNVANTSTNLEAAVYSIINGVIGVLSLICVIVIIVGGVNYMTSSGDTAKVKKAKDTILYGIIGLVVCVLAFAIVNFVIKNILK